LLPQTMRVREGTEITGGNVRVEFVGAEHDGARRWTGLVTLAGLSAINDRRAVSWEIPLESRFQAHRDRDGGQVIVDQLTCQSDFLQLKGSGTLEDAKFRLDGDLTRLQQNLERFVDLGHEQLAGRMRAEGTIWSDKVEHVKLTSTVSLDDFAYVLSKEKMWREQHLELTAAATGQMDETRQLTRINAGLVRLKSDGDSLELMLQKPVDLSAKESLYSATAKGNGRLTTWQNRLRPFVEVPDWRLAGNIDLAAVVTCSSQQVSVSQLNIALEQLEARGPQWLVQEQQTRLETSGMWDVAARTLTSPKTTLTGPSLACEVENLVCVLGPTGLTKLTGEATYRADLKQISRWKD
ncbi:MAG TPA: hypothetical protein VK137_06145, partial [Planctomycetaceae bacterium]|nr:hypothetical protein [Planctomycetaceae bacterium]